LHCTNKRKLASQAANLPIVLGGWGVLRRTRARHGYIFRRRIAIGMIKSDLAADAPPVA
jgi:hypothetical protein